MTVRATRVRLPDGSLIDLAVASDLRHWQRHLRDSYDLGDAMCHCTTKPIPLSICRLERNRKVKYYLRSHPGSGNRHASWCLFEGSPDDEVHPPVRDDVLRIDCGWSMREPTGEPGEPQGSRPRGPAHKRTGLKYVVRDLWSAAKLDQHDPISEVRSSTFACSLLAKAARDPRFETPFGPLSDMLILVPSAGKPEYMTTYQNRCGRVLARSLAEGHRVLLIGEPLTFSKPEKTAAWFLIRRFDQIGGDWHCAWNQYVSTQVLSKFTYPHLIGEAGLRLLVALVGEPQESSRTIWVRDAYMFATTLSYFPIVSTAERALVDQLIAQRRRFALRDGEIVLLDVDHPLPLRVAGAATEWTWDGQGQMPALPTATVTLPPLRT